VLAAIAAVAAAAAVVDSRVPPSNRDRLEMGLAAWSEDGILCEVVVVAVAGVAVVTPCLLAGENDWIVHDNEARTSRVIMILVLVLVLVLVLTILLLFHRNTYDCCWFIASLRR
jgi:hypothetical protein